MLRKITLSLLLAVFGLVGMSVAVAPPAAVAPANASAIIANSNLAIDSDVAVEEFLNMTPKKYREMTGKKLSLKETIAMKLAQKKVKKQLRKGQGRDDIPVGKTVFIILAILVPIAAVIMMGIADEWDGNNWWIALLLYALCYLPGLIYTLTKINDYSYNE